MQLLPFSNPSLSPDIEISARFEALKEGYRLGFELKGNGARKIELPEAAHHPKRKDELWKQTCFECFFGVAHSTRYFEFNGSPSGDWALYSFSDYRAGMSPVQVDREPKLESVEKNDDWIRVIWFIPYFTKELFQTVGITAILQSKPNPEKPEREMSYWALKHAGEKPDFHLRQGFAIRLF